MIKQPTPRVLVVFGTWHGQTQLIANKLAVFARRHGYDAEVSSAKEARLRDDLATFDRFVVCAGVQSRKHHRAAKAFVTTNLETLASRPSAFVSVSLSAGAPNGTPDRQGIQGVVDAFLRDTAWSPDATVLAAGALHYTRYGFLTRWMMRRISAAHDGPTDTSRDYEMTDWGQLERDIAQFFPTPVSGTTGRSAAIL